MYNLLHNGSWVMSFLSGFTTCALCLKPEVDKSSSTFFKFYPQIIDFTFFLLVMFSRCFGEGIFDFDSFSRKEPDHCSIMNALQSKWNTSVNAECKLSFKCFNRWITEWMTEGMKNSIKDGFLNCELINKQSTF